MDEHVHGRELAFVIVDETGESKALVQPQLLRPALKLLGVVVFTEEGTPDDHTLRRTVRERPGERLHEDVLALPGRQPAHHADAQSTSLLRWCTAGELDVVAFGAVG